MAEPKHELKVELDDALLRRIDQQAADHGYASTSAYVHDLIEAAAVVSEEDTAALRAALREGLNSGDSIPVDEVWWEQRRQRLTTMFGHPR